MPRCPMYRRRRRTKDASPPASRPLLQVYAVRWSSFDHRHQLEDCGLETHVLKPRLREVEEKLRTTGHGVEAEYDSAAHVVRHARDAEDVAAAQRGANGFEIVAKTGTEVDDRDSALAAHPRKVLGARIGNDGLVVRQSAHLRKPSESRSHLLDDRLGVGVTGLRDEQYARAGASAGGAVAIV